ncbi:MAG: hypothetical protein V2I97_07655 [Desulfococcaceae bacterium]|jgi:acid stress-induced BolA-like protein IbaG/YrbA|nr:hypothetical protein [Desulfococcaceae bacterium]
MDFKEELENILSDMGFSAQELELEKTPAGKIGGFVISDSFSGKSQMDRQNMLWEQLDRILDEEKRSKIIGILTMTPAEAEEAEAAA